MSSKPRPITLGFNGSEWTTGDLAVRVRSLSEPDREVPLTLQLTAVPPCLTFQMAGEGSGKLATVSVNPDATLPADDRALIHVVADPATEMAMTIASAALPPGVSIPRPFPRMTAQVEVLLVPYVLQVRQRRQVGNSWSEADLGPGAGAELEGNGCSCTLLEVTCHRVDARGNPQGEPVNSDLKVSQHPVEGGAGASVTVERTGTGLTVKFQSTKPCFDSGVVWGSLLFHGTGPGGKHLESRTVRVQVHPLQAALTLLSPADARLGLAPGTEEGAPVQATLRLEALNSQNTGVAGLFAEFRLDPAAGTVQPSSGRTDESGHLQVTYRAPTSQEVASLGQGGDFSVRVVATAGPDRREVGSQTLRLAWQQTLTLKVSKPGFDTVEKKVTVSRPGPVGVLVLPPTPTRVPQELRPVAHATVEIEGTTATTDRDGRAQVGEGAGPGETLTVRLALDAEARGAQSRLLEIAPLAELPVAPDRFKLVVQDFVRFAEVEFVERLAEQEPQEHKDTLFSVKLLAAATRVLPMARALLVRRYGRISGDFTDFCRNLAAACYSRWGEKKAGELVQGIASKAKGLFTWAAHRLASHTWIRAAMKPLVRGLRWVLDGVDSLGNKFTDWFRRKGFFAEGKMPGNLKSRLPRTPDDGPFPIQRGQMVRPDARLFKQAERQARDLVAGLERKLASARELAENLAPKMDDLKSQLAAAQKTLGEAVNPRTKARWAAQVQKLEGELGGVRGTLEKARKSLDDLLPERDKAARALDEVLLNQKMAEESASMLDDALSSMLGVLNRIWNFGTYVVVYLSAMVFGMFRPVAKKYANKYYPLLGEVFWNTLDDVVFKPSFSDLVGGTPSDGIVPYIGRSLESRQLNAGAEALASALKRTRGFNLVCEDAEDKEQVRAAFRWYYETIEANGFTAEAWECYAEWFAETLDWVEFGIVWSCRGANAILALLALIFSIPSGGGSLAAFLALQPQLTAFIESMDKVWDWLKAVARGGKALVGALEVAAVILPAHVAYTAKLYREDSIMLEADQAWGYPVPEGRS